ncbi:hypothetical protein [Nocardia nova]
MRTRREQYDEVIGKLARIAEPPTADSLRPLCDASQTSTTNASG